MSIKSSYSHDGPLPSNGDILRAAVLKKLKTSRKKYFVLRAETPDSLARLEYYDSEKKFKTGAPPKRSIALRTCFNINRKPDGKHKHVIALYTKDDCFSVAFESEDQLKLWLKDFLTLQHGEELTEGEVLKPKFEYVWPVNLCGRGLGDGRTGRYRLCLTDDTITLIKQEEAIPSIIRLSLTSVRSCGNLKNFFFLEVGRMSEIGAGEIWCEAEDTNIALNIQHAVSHRFKLARERNKAETENSSTTAASGTEQSDLQPKGRIRSASATESSSKTSTKKFNPLKFSKQVSHQDTTPTPERSLNPSVTSAPSGVISSTSSGGGTGWSMGPNHQRTQSLPLATPPVSTALPLSTTTTTITSNSIINNITATTSNISLINHHSSALIKKAQSAAGSGKCTIAGYRLRSDSMPSRPRTSSEGTHSTAPWGKPKTGTHYFKDGIAHSPPGGTAMSPPSDSTGSSYSLPDEHDGGVHEHQRMYPTMTPDEAIAEEDCPESPRAVPGYRGSDYMPMNFRTDYMDMTSGGQNTTSSTASMNSVNSGTPSTTDMRLSEYPLDKVYSYVSEDDDTRPCRAYSVGSKPPEGPQCNPMDSVRVRAFSVGSKTKKYFNRVLPPHHYQPPGGKSNSAPMLMPQSFTGSSHSSIHATNPMDDLMEMDFTANDPARSRSGTNGSRGSHKNGNGAKNKIWSFLENLGFGGDKTASTNSNNNTSTTTTTTSVSPNSSEGYADMRSGPRVKLSDLSQLEHMDAFLPRGPVGISPYVDMGGHNAHNNIPLVGHPLSPYLDMSGNGNRVPLVGHPLSPYLDMSGGTNGNGAHANQAIGNGNAPYRDTSDGSGVAQNNREDYMDMSGSSPARGSPRSSNVTDYMRASIQNQLLRHPFMDQRYRANSNSSTSSRAATSPGNWNNDRSHDYLDMSGKNATARRPERTNSMGSQMSSSPYFDSLPSNSSRDTEGYVEMTPGDLNNVRHQRQSSIESNENDHGDYLNMSGVGESLNPVQVRSTPIAILTSSGNTIVKNSSPISISSLLGRKPSPTLEGSPKMHLPLNPYSTLPRQRSARQPSSQAGSSKESSLNSSVTTTPSTMFPMSLNSPSSPELEFSKASTSTNNATVKVPASVLNVPYRNSGTKKKILNEDYTMMNFGPFRAEEPPYMNYCPSPYSPRVPAVNNRVQEDTSGDYAIMKPGVLPAKSNTLPRPKGHAKSPDDSKNKCFIPIREKDERMSSPKPGDLPDKVTQDDKTLETANVEFSDDDSNTARPFGSLTARTPRPNSSNSEKILSSDGTSRPSSVCSEGLASRLGSNSSVYSSSSSTSTVVGVATKANQTTNPEQYPTVCLHYASLDLSIGGDGSETQSSPRTVRSATGETDMAEGPATTTTTLVYADIDFVRSEEFSKGVNPSTGNGTSATVKN